MGSLSVFLIVFLVPRRRALIRLLLVKVVIVIVSGESVFAAMYGRNCWKNYENRDLDDKFSILCETAYTEALSESCLKNRLGSAMPIINIL